MQFCGLGSPKPRPGVDYQPYKAPRATRAQSPATGFAALATVTREAEVGCILDVFSFVRASEAGNI